MKTPLYRQALSHGWKLAWNHTWLWPLGLFAALLGQMGLIELFTKLQLGANNFALSSIFLGIRRAGGEGLGLTLSSVPEIAWLLVSLFALLLGLVFVAVVSQGALVSITARSTKSKKLPDIGTSWHVGVKHGWRVFFINVLKKLAMWGLAVVIGWATANVFLDPSGGDLWMFVAIFLLASLVGLVLSFLAIYAIGYVVVEEYGFVDAVSAAWHLFTDHWLVSLEVGLIVLVFNALLALVGVFGVFVFFIPSLILWVVSLLVGSGGLLLGGFLLGLLLSIFWIVFLGSVFSVFTTSVWTYLFMAMHKKGVKSRLIHWFH